MNCAVQKNSLSFAGIRIVGTQPGRAAGLGGGQVHLGHCCQDRFAGCDLIIITLFNKGGRVICMSRISHDILYSNHFTGKPNYSRLSIGSEGCMKLDLCTGSCHLQIDLRFCSKY